MVFKTEGLIVGEGEDSMSCIIKPFIIMDNRECNEILHSRECEACDVKKGGEKSDKNTAYVISGQRTAHNEV